MTLETVGTHTPKPLAYTNELLYWSKNRLALVFEIDRRRIDKALLTVAPSAKDAKDNPLWKMADVAPAIIAEIKGIVFDSEAEKIDPEKLPPRDRKEWWQSESAKDRVLKERGLLLERDDVHYEMAKLAKTLASGLESIPDRLERDCGLSPHMIDTVVDIIDEIRDQIADDVIFDCEDE